MFRHMGKKGIPFEVEYTLLEPGNIEPGYSYY